MDDLLEWLMRNSSGRILASVADYTAPAISFFQKNGFSVGDYVDDLRRLARINGVVVPEIWLVRG